MPPRVEEERNRRREAKGNLSSRPQLHATFCPCREVMENKAGEQGLDLRMLAVFVATLAPCLCSRGALVQPEEADSPRST